MSPSSSDESLSPSSSLMPISTEGPQRPVETPPKRGPWAMLAAAGAFALGKLKFLLVGLKALKLWKFALTAGSMALMIWFEATRSGWPFAVGFVLLILVHELGHGVAIKRSGLSSGWPVFIPFFGALITLKGQIQSPEVEAEIAYAGPIAGTVASAALIPVYFATGARLPLALAYTGFFLNLFNMIPIRPLDGGRVAQAFSRRAWIIGTVLLGGMFLLSRAPQLLLIGVLALSHIFRGRRAPVTELVTLSPEAQQRWSIRYFGLCFFLGAAAYLSHRLLGRGDG